MSLNYLTKFEMFAKLKFAIFWTVSQDPAPVHQTIIVQQQPVTTIPPSYAYLLSAPPSHTTITVS